MESDVKEAYRLFWLVKGGLHAPHDTIMASAKGYFYKVWYDYEGQDVEAALEGFEEAYASNKEKRKMGSLR